MTRVALAFPGSGEGDGVCAAARLQNTPVRITVGSASLNKLIVFCVLILNLTLPEIHTPGYRVTSYQSPYQAPLAEAIKGEAPCDKERCEPKLTEGSEMVREAPRPSSTETLNDWYPPLIGNGADG
jgi:hypothetical protein